MEDIVLRWGMNFADLIRLKESQLSDTSLIFTRMKTELTRIIHVTDISIPVTEALKRNIEILKFFKDNPIPGFGLMKDSPYLLGLLPENYTEQEHKNKRHKVRHLIRQELLEVSKKLNLPVPLQLKSARDCFATTLFRSGVSLEIIGSFLGHGSVLVTANYIGSLDIEDFTDAFSKLVF